MKRFNFDFFKISIILILLGFLLCFHLFTKNGRYVKTDNFSVVLDSRNGTLTTPQIKQEP